MPNNFVSPEQLAEYQAVNVRRDIVRLIAVNAVILIVLLVVYYANLRSGFLEKWFFSLAKF